MTKKLSDEEVGRLLLPYGFRSDPPFCENLRAYVILLQRWNSKISLTTVTDPHEIVKFHFGESLFAVSALQIEKSRLADVGTGAGFPGLPIAMAVPGLELTLVEPVAKKCAFLAEVVRALGLTGVTIFRGRMEAFRPDSAKFDWVAARALGLHDELLSWATAHLHPSGRVALWLGEGDAAPISRSARWDWRDPILIPGSERRYLLAGSPKR